ncbi:hypothetical protein ABZ671_01655 [Micromonospora sp. NPDC006766]|uniref:hypothetical protein n=1 Tax=Micromonospora sp. NPDC006766 TaxID=3154778 RepID=UPI0033E0EBB1
MSDFWLGVLSVFAAVGGLGVLLGLGWLVVVFLPEGVWWTVKRLPLHDQFRRDRAAAVCASARRAYTLRIPFGVRLVLTFGEHRDRADEVMALLGRGRDQAATERTSAE